MDFFFDVKGVIDFPHARSAYYLKPDSYPRPSRTRKAPDTILLSFFVVPSGQGRREWSSAEKVLGRFGELPSPPAVALELFIKKAFFIKRPRKVVLVADLDLK